MKGSQIDTSRLKTQWLQYEMCMLNCQVDEVQVPRHGAEINSYINVNFNNITF